MALSVKKGSFAKATGAAPASQAITGLGFQPKALFLWVTDQTAEGYQATARVGAGFTTGATQSQSVSLASVDAVTTTDTQRNNNDGCLVITNEAGTILARATLTSFDASGFTLSWATNDANAYIVHYLALGDADLANAFAGGFTQNNTLGNQAIAGIGFQPDLVIFLSATRTAAPSGTSTGAIFGMGAAKSSTARWALATSLQNAVGPSNSAKRQVTNRCLVWLNTSAVFVGDSDFVSMDTDGFTIDVTDIPGFTPHVAYLALKGGQYAVGSDTQRTNVGTQTKTGIGFQPVAALFAGVNAASAAGNTDTGKFSLGASDGTNEGCVWFEDQDAVSTTEVNERSVTTKVLTHSTGPSTTNAEADLSFDADGYILDWTTADATAREFLFLLMGNAAGAAARLKADHAVGRGIGRGIMVGLRGR